MRLSKTLTINYSLSIERAGTRNGKSSKILSVGPITMTQNYSIESMTFESFVTEFDQGV